ncbi:MAG TPA: DoxX-like family protein [Chitinophagaceae bacterium]|nr:DoxX-like family protein [Chitinophagaceae bacterium]
MRKHHIQNWLHYIIALVWIINGLFCKVLNLVPRHEEIVARILGNEHARLLTFLIGLAEMGMAAWVLSSIQKRFNAVTQMLLIATMNSLEFFLAPDLLLWGRANAFFAFAFIASIYYNEFHLSKKYLNRQHAFFFKKSSLIR